MDKLIFEGVRCFHEHYSIPLKPITLLVGENSSGKTTFLALARIAWEIAGGNPAEDIFNEEPFLLGSYDQIASYRGGRAGRAASFTVGAEFALPQQPGAQKMPAGSAKITARFVPAGAAPRLEERRFEGGNFTIQAKSSLQDLFHSDIMVATPSGRQVSSERDPFFSPWTTQWSILQMISVLRSYFSEKFSKDEMNELVQISVRVLGALGKQRPYAFAPIRTRPQRTYDPVREVPKPEGSHVPMVLARIMLDSENGGDLKAELDAFGRASGLFNSLEVKRKGRKEGDPFQIGVKAAGPAFNLVDVGYGVSQVLPIIVDTVLNAEANTFLLQQPEVHLHPRAQAELGSFLAGLAVERQKRFIIETHSDYIVDRIRLDVRDKKRISRDDVVILYFERTREGVHIHELGIDEFGNITNAPPSYRQFFLDEERRMLGV